MIEKIKLPLDTELFLDSESKILYPVSLFGMCCSHNGHECDYNSSGLAVICAGQQRLEGRKLQYEILENSSDNFVYSATDAAATIRFTGSWNFHRQYSLISCHSTIANTSGEPQVIRRALPRWCFAPGRYDVYFHMSRWGAENQLQKLPLAGNDILLHGLPARSTVGSTPFCILKDTTNNTAAIFHVIPCGNWAINIHSAVNENELPMPVVEAGLADTDLFITLQPCESLELPEVLIQQCPAGDIYAPAAQLHKYFNDLRIPDSGRRSPVVYNGWLYRFTDFTREQILQQAKAAKEIGCEVFIVDAGWFGYGDGWSKVGDWREKTGAPFFGKMANFADEIRAMGMKFGFWMEPERWEADIPVRGEHPEWFPAHSNRIDLTNPDAAEYVFNTIASNVRKYKAGYIKIDFNSHTGYDDSGCEMYKYCLARHALIICLHNEFPDLIIENCGSGGLRSDLQMTMLFDHSFISDNAAPWETVRILQGYFMRNLPGRTLNWAVIRPAQERLTPYTPGLKVMACAGASWDSAILCNLDFVLISSMLGILSFSGDIAGLDSEARKMMAEAAEYYKNNREFFRKSCVHLLTPPSSTVTDYENIAVLQMQSCAKSDSLVFVFSYGSSRIAMRKFRMKDLEPDAEYTVKKLFSADSCEYNVSGRELMEYGIKAELVDMHIQPHSAALYEVTKL